MSNNITTDYFLRDVFESAVDSLKSGPRALHTPQEISEALKKAAQKIMRVEQGIMRSKTESYWEDLVAMVQKWDQDRAEGRRIYAAPNDPVWKA